MLYILTFDVVIASTVNSGRECSFSFKSKEALPHEEAWKIATRNVLLQLKPDEYMESLTFKDSRRDN